MGTQEKVRLTDREEAKREEERRRNGGDRRPDPRRFEPPVLTREPRLPDVTTGFVGTFDP